jgi:2-polyprenyl-6-methoxyphenol hydroxylase-like FAD-dependent oxidoreductase
MVAVAVLIVGCGPAGLTAARELLRRGIGCRLADKRPALQSSTRAPTADEFASAASFVKMGRA